MLSSWEYKLDEGFEGGKDTRTCTRSCVRTQGVFDRLPHQETQHFVCFSRRQFQHLRLSDTHSQVRWITNNRLCSLHTERLINVLHCCKSRCACINVSSELLGDSTELYLLDYSIFSRDRAYADSLPIVYCLTLCVRVCVCVCVCVCVWERERGESRYRPLHHRWGACFCPGKVERMM